MTNFQFPEDLESFRNGLVNNQVLLLRAGGNGLACSFLKEGIVCHSIVIQDQILADALWKTCESGILEGVKYLQFKYSFESFMLRIKAKWLYKELAATLPYLFTKQQVIA
ncbi:hypothetical protein [Pontibacter sp. SGAir0037]|uniref:hypothetical protein n=1 Tax=Pontibacter sp. SGAir0037 TaxID=2571030 RepID=UPI0010CD0964|nr:hypothetical protein [Pontibacter sp. SGAir0037]QCR21479.1 hypothetical protein C1N53_03370 [Pontibacter sp. SGAir0037]